VRRLLKIVAVLVVVLLVGGAAFAWYTSRRPFPDHAGRLVVPGLTDEVEVVRDAHGVPHIYAANAEDLFRAQGFVHAQDRFFEMDFRRHVTSGRLAELFGEDQVETDAFLRTMGWRRIAEAELELVSDDTRAVLAAYAAGVNAYAVGAHPWDLGLEYAFLGLQQPGYAPEPWEPVHSVAWLKAMAWDLRGNVGDEIERVLVAAAVGPQRTEDLYPGYPFERHPVIVDGAVVSGAWVPSGASAGAAVVAAGGEVRPLLDPAVVEVLRGVRDTAARVPELLGPAGDGLGSNSWAITGDRTASGLPLLANDPHLGPALPSLWYQVGLHCRPVSEACPYDLVGFSFSGVPGIVIGYNDRVAWGFTNLGPDVTDLVVERLDGDRYEVDGEWLDLDVHTETITVAGGDPVEVTIRWSANGPLLSDASETYADVASAAPDTPDDGAAYGVALRWTALEPGRTADAILALNTAGNWQEFREAAALFEVPSQNLVYADVDGHIGYQAPGKIPIRRGYDGRWPVAGWDSANDWVGFLPFEELPWTLDPVAGFVATANNAVAGPTDAPRLTTDWSRGYRAQRIDDLLAAAGDDLTAADMLAMQLDTYNGFGPVLTPYLQDVTVPGAVADALALLRDWDFTQPPDSAPAAFFNATWRHLLARTFHDELPEDARPSGNDRWFEVVRGLLDDPESPWWDDVTTDARESRDDMLVGAMTDAHDELTQRLGRDPARWRWGALHTLPLTHQTLGTSGIGLVEGRFNRGPLELGGGKDILNATGWTASNGYEVDWVPSMRMIVDLADLDRSEWVHLTGQSGHPYHPNYTDQASLWRDGGMLPMRMTEDVVRGDAAATLVLAPE
jgi:penicillin G amidase